MSDRFKFRVWDTGNKRYQGSDDWLPLIDKDGDICFHNIDGVLEYPPENNYFIIEQCTGLKDKNGNLIYEGDLIKSPNNSYPLEIVRIPNGVYGCKVHKISPVWEMNLYSLINAYDIEIIGNIHEQKEQQ